MEIDWKPPEQIPVEDFSDEVDYWLALKPGMVIETVDGDVILVGNINTMGGSCDCCPEFKTHNTKHLIKRWGWIVGIENIGLEE